ncbi:MAG: S46 family peptidase [Breznakibacter sp.]
MKKSLTVFLLVAISWNALADEGMWLPIWLKSKEIEKMYQMGLSISFEQVYSQTLPSMKDAVVSLDGGGCTGEFVSDEGLLLTNHHCGFDNIQSHSSIENDYIKNGFWAKSRSEELSNPGKTATLLIRAMEVSHLYDPFLKMANNEKARIRAVDSLTTVFEADASDSTGLEARIGRFFNDTRFVLFLTKTYRDIRLVGTPPNHIGNFGGETDNWMWPRHTGDFSIFRVYCGPDGEPADYSPNNVPFKPKKFLPVSISGIQENDFVMAIGYPGTTNRYSTSSDIQSVRNSQNPIVDEVRTIKQNILKARMAQSPQLAIQYAAKYDQSANYQKYAFGQNQGIDKLGLIDAQTTKEEAWRKQFLELGDTSTMKTLDRYNNFALQFDNIVYTVKLMEESLIQGVELPYFALQYMNALFELKHANPLDSSYITRRADLIKLIDTHFKDYDASVDKELFNALIGYAYKKQTEHNLPYSFIPKPYKDNVGKYADKIYSRTLFTNPDKLKTMVDGKISRKLRKDEMIRLLQSSFQQYNELSMITDALHELQNMTLRQVHEALVKLYPDSSFYPDANSTMRITYGRVEPYVPRDGVSYDYFTTSDGVLAKIDPAVKEFDVPTSTSNLMIQHDFGRYASNGQLTTCFITTNDITGGNSGSPVINGQGQLVGLAFDGNWEAMTSDLAFAPNRQRTICVDIRYVLWTIEKIGQATHLINEMTIE